MTQNKTWTWSVEPHQHRHFNRPAISFLLILGIMIIKLAWWPQRLSIVLPSQWISLYGNLRLHFSPWVSWPTRTLEDAVQKLSPLHHSVTVHGLSAWCIIWVWSTRFIWYVCRPCDIPQVSNIPYQPCWSNPYSAYSPTQKNSFFQN